MKWLKKALVRAALSRPDSALVRSSGGVAQVIDGRTLDARFQYLAAQARKAPRVTPSPKRSRAQVDEMVYLFGGEPEPGVRWNAIAIPSTNHVIPARLYRPVGQDQTVPAIVFNHFGGGVVGGLETCHAFCTMLASAAKTVVVSVDYRLAPEHRWPAGLDDALSAYLWTTQNAALFGASVGTAAIGGDSMGGNFAAIIAQEMMRRGGPAPALQLLIYPATNLLSADGSMIAHANAFPLNKATMDWFMSEYLPPGADKKDLRLSPAYEGDVSRLPPALIYTAGFDPLVDQGAAYAEALRAVGVRVLYRCYDSLAHGFTAFTGAIPAADAACREMSRETAQALRA